MSKSEEIFKRVDELEKTEFVTAVFGNNWKAHAKKNTELYSRDDLIDIAHKQGRRAILLERVIKELVELEQSKSSDGTHDELIKDIIQGAEDFKNHHDKPYDNNTLKNCLIELRNKIESSEGEGKEELKKEAKEMMNLSYIKKIENTPPCMKKQLILITWAKKMAEMILNDK